MLEARPEALDEFRAALNLDFSDTRRQEVLTAEGDGLEVIEVVAPESARITGRTAQALGLAWRQSTVLMGISRQGRRITEQVRKTEVEAGDILLLLCPRDRGADVTEWLGCLPLAERGLNVTANEKAWLAIGLFATAVLAASIGLIYLPIALGLVVVAYVLTKIMPIADIYNHIEWPVVVLLGSMIPLGSALETSGGTELIANALIQLTNGLPAWAILTVLMVVTMTLSDVLNNTATAIVAAPVGIQMARTLEVSPDPFPDDRCCCCLCRVSHADWTQEQYAGPGPWRLPLRGLLAHGSAVGDIDHRGFDPRDPCVLAALTGKGCA